MNFWVKNLKIWLFWVEKLKILLFWPNFLVKFYHFVHDPLSCAKRRFLVHGYNEFNAQSRNREISFTGDGNQQLHKMQLSKTSTNQKYTLFFDEQSTSSSYFDNGRFLFAEIREAGFSLFDSPSDPVETLHSAENYQSGTALY